jgi:hypothetical protein
MGLAIEAGNVWPQRVLTSRRSPIRPCHIFETKAVDTQAFKEHNALGICGRIMQLLGVPLLRSRKPVLKTILKTLFTVALKWAQKTLSDRNLKHHCIHLRLPENKTGGLMEANFSRQVIAPG